jgi:DNA-binding NtrC family response regulator
MSPFSELKKFKTLLVDDDDLIRDSLSLAFSSRGCAIRTVESAEEGLEAMQNENFNIVISDLRLPGEGGIAFLQAAASRHPEAVNVLLTAYRDDHLLAETDFVDIHELVEKPFSAGSLASTLAFSIKSKSRNQNKTTI